MKALRSTEPDETRSVLRDVQIITSVELVKGWCVKGIQQIREIWLGQITAGTKTES